MYVITYVCNLKNKMNEYNKASTYSQILENKLVVTSGKRSKEGQEKVMEVRGTNYYT